MKGVSQREISGITGARCIGYADGQNIAIEPRGSDDIPRLYDLATDLVQSKVDVIVTQGTPGVQAAQRATRTTPIVMPASGDAVKLGLVASLGRPGGNITGQTIIAAEYIGNGWRFCGKSFPAFRASQSCGIQQNPGLIDQMKSAEGIAKTLGVALQRVEPHYRRLQGSSPRSFVDPVLPKP
jgi:putative tryptophan/tyrosine transport system substrate-binding protein